MSAKAVVETPIQLYRHLMRIVKRLPAASQDYYKNHVRQNFNSHSDESDPERIKQIVSRALDDAQWLEKKYIQKT